MRIFVALLALQFIAAGPAGDLYQPAYCLDHQLRCPAHEYVPQAGDVVLYSFEGDLFWDIGFKFAFTGKPYHCGVVVRMPDNTLGILESGPDDSDTVRVLALTERLKFHHCNRGRVYIRQRKIPLTEEQSNRLTQFALSEYGKPFALWRMLGQVTPLRTRKPFKLECQGMPQGPHDDYWCSECALESLVFAGLLDAETTRPAATYPREMFFDRSPNPYLKKHFSMACGWEPPARWVIDGCCCCKAWKGSFHNPNPAAIPVHPFLLR